MAKSWFATGTCMFGRSIYGPDRPELWSVGFKIECVKYVLIQFVNHVLIPNTAVRPYLRLLAIFFEGAT